MEDDVDLFAEHGFSEDEGSDPGLGDDQGQRPRASRSRRQRVKNDPVVRTFGILAILVALAAALVGIAAAVRAVAPAAVAQLGGYSVQYLAVATFIAVGIALIMVILARVVSRMRSGRRGIASSAIVIMVCAAMLGGGSLLVAHLFPDGIIKPAVTDNAPVSNASQMEQGLEQVAGACEGGWSEVATGSYPGVSHIAVCKSTRVAFITFDSKAAAALYSGPAEQKISDLMDQYSTDQQTEGDWRILSGGQWIAVGDKQHMSSLQKLWGGSLKTAQ